jgi:branched-subunit amino acid ABC-type transport system permease component
LVGVVAIGTAVGAIAASMKMRLDHATRLMPLGILMGVCVIAMNFIDNLWVAVPFLIVLGGLGNPMGALIAGIFYGIAEQMATVFLAQALAQIVGFGMLVVTILVRPTGLFGFRVLR